MAIADGIRTRLAAALLAGALLPWSLPAAGQVQASPIRDEDRTVFDTLYREKLTTVERTRTVTDDRTLANEMMGFAAGLPERDAGVRSLIYIQTINLASTAGDLGQMKEALELLYQAWPKQDAVTPEVLMQLASRAYKRVERRDREQQGGYYIDMLLQVAQRYEADKDTEQAYSVSRLASTIARAINSDQLESIQLKIERLAAANDMAKRIRMLELSVQKNPQNSPAARELVKLLITQQNDTPAAAKYVKSTSDEELIDLVTGSANGIDQANAATAMRIADWYVILAEDERDENAVRLLQQSLEWYGRFFSLYRRDDALAKRVREMSELAQAKIDELVEGSPDLSDVGNNGKGRWLNLTAKPYNALEHVFGTANNIQVNGNDETILRDTAMMVPYKPSEAYELRITMTVNKDARDGKPALVVHLPVDGDRLLTTRYFVDHFHIAQVDEVSETRLIEPAPAAIGQKVQLTFQIVERDGQLAMAMLYNGKAGIKWQGDTEELEEIDKDMLEKIPDELGSVFVLYGDRDVTIHVAEYRERF